MQEKKEFLLEILSEEIPSGFQKNAEVQLKNLLETKLADANFSCSDIKIYSTPRRLCVICFISQTSSVKKVEKRGPLVDSPQKAIDGFLNNNNATLGECLKKEINGKEYLFIEKEDSAKKFEDEFPKIFSEILQQFKWPKSMRWGNFEFAWARPIRNVLCMFDGRKLSFQIDELNLQTSTETIGHRFIGSEVWFSVKNVSDYLENLTKNCVILNRKDREESILKQFADIEKTKNIKIELHQGLLEEVIGLTEYPTVLIGEIPDEFMNLPAEVLELTMRTNQRYFVAKNADKSLSKFFMIVANIPGIDNGNTIVKGNQKVLNARLSDARFFIETDCKRKLDDYLPGLKSLSYQDGIGTIFDKTQRIIKIAEKLENVCSNISDLKRAALLCKCDLKSTAVGEFPELQGVIGGHYAKYAGESPYVWKAIYEQYLPLGEKMPNTEGGCLLSICDKLDSLVGLFAINKAPTGSKDPFALRRAAISVIRIMDLHDIRIDNLENILSFIFKLYKDAFPTTKLIDDTPAKVMKFFCDRLKVIAKDLNIRENVLCVFENENIAARLHKARILNKFLQTELGEKTLQVFKRAYSVVDKCIDTNIIDLSLFELDEEMAMYSATTDAELLIKRSNNIEEKLEILASIYSTSSRFFDNVMINTENVKLRENRTTLAAKILRIYNNVGDFSKLILR